MTKEEMRRKPGNQTQDDLFNRHEMGDGDAVAHFGGRKGVANNAFPVARAKVPGIGVADVDLDAQDRSDAENKCDAVKQPLHAFIFPGTISASRPFSHGLPSDP